VFAFDLQFSYVVEGVVTPNWRERLVCQGCGLNNRMRAALHVLVDSVRPDAAVRVLVAERNTPFFGHLFRHYPRTTGFEYLGRESPLGTCRADGTRNEDLRDLTFPDASFDVVLAFDVFEHIADVERAIIECRRVLSPGGCLFLSVPFLFSEPKNTIRARLRRDGSIEHLMEPEYHADSLNSAGCLAFYHFGWEFLDQLCASGLRSVAARTYWSRRYGYLGAEQVVVTATRPVALAPTAAASGPPGPKRKDSWCR
jgi:SAM-dependent methyltransferase